jgi:transcriptional regulator with XRE-family HTH domain
MLRFDAKALYRAMDERRTSHEMSWAQVAAETGVSAATIQRTRSGGRMEVDGMLAMVVWLGVTVETLVREVQS